MSLELPKLYSPKEIEGKVYERWQKSGAFAATPDSRPPERRYVIMMPLPNVTGALHMGHAMDNVMQDMLIRWRRMGGDNTLWQPGTDHAGIATQAVIEKRLYELEGKTRHDIGREALVSRILAWKDEYQQRIINQQKQMGCSCDWDRQRFTMDEVCSAAVYETFFRLFCDRLIYLGLRLVNWDCHLQTAVSDDEIYYQSEQSHMWYLRYPLIEPGPGEPEYVVVATTRPETMFGDTAVACHPDPADALTERISEQESKVKQSGEKDRDSAEAELDRLRARERDVLPLLQKLTDMAREGRKVLLPLVDREIPLILDEWAKPEFGSGCVKITPAHDQNDYEVWQRHRDEIGAINALDPDGTMNEHAGPCAGMDRFQARDKAVDLLEEKGLLDHIEDHELELLYSDRSKTPIEPYLSKQWFVKMGDVEGGVRMGKGTEKEFSSPGLAQAAMDAVDPDWKTKTGRNLTFHPERYTKVYTSWLSEKRDWCISRQLWWGHRIPVWLATLDDKASADELINKMPDDPGRMFVWATDSTGAHCPPRELAERDDMEGPFELLACLRHPEHCRDLAEKLTELGFRRDPDVLDTWFSSALWPFSTLGWPDPENAPVEEGQPPLGSIEGRPDSFSYYYPGSCLVTARDIITLWVARMVVMGLYCHGDVPFVDCFVHAKILDGKGETMSKSKGNGIDPVDIIDYYGADAMRYLLCEMETGMQDIRLPVQAVCPECEARVELSEAGHGKTIFTYICTFCGKEFDVLGTMDEVPRAVLISERFENGRAFCNKLWNASRFAIMNLSGFQYKLFNYEELEPEDRWILSRLSRTVEEVSTKLSGYHPADAVKAVRAFFWNEFCDWYLEFIKPRMQDADKSVMASQVLVVCLDQVIRLLHPFLPFITEELWSYLAEYAPRRGVDKELQCGTMCIHAPWPEQRPEWIDPELEQKIGRVQEIVCRFRELRACHEIAPRKKLPCLIKTTPEEREDLEKFCHLISDQAFAAKLTVCTEEKKLENAVVYTMPEAELHLGGVVDPEKEKERLKNQRQKIMKDLEASRKKLDNEKFLEKAPQEVVDNEKRKAEEMESQLSAVEDRLKALCE
ncbi:MAG: valine--tRNA ligase [bacterium]